VVTRLYLNFNKIWAAGKTIPARCNELYAGKELGAGKKTGHSLHIRKTLDLVRVTGFWLM
jgi:hypothetical protein